MRQINAAALAAWLDDQQRPAPTLIDVREPWEFRHCRIEGSLSMPMAVVPARMAEIERECEIVLICHHGGRSAQVGLFLEYQGFTRVFNLAGGVAGWAAQVDPQMPQY